MKRFRLSLFAVASLLCFGCASEQSGLSISPEICDASNNYCKGDLVCSDGECAPTDPADCKDKCCNVCDGKGCVDCPGLPDENLECKNKCCSECAGIGCVSCSGNNDDPASPKDCKNKCCDSCDGNGCIDCSQCKGKSCKECPGAGCKADDCSGKCCSECSGDGCRECGSTMADACPPKGSVGKMNFIVNMATCTSFGCSLANDYSVSFIEGRCPDDYPECIESETRGVWGCIGDGPAVQEPVETKDDGSVSSDAFSCNGNIVDPASFDTCGATADNCAGTSCSIFWDGRSCRKVDGVYDCRCPEGQIECAGRCVDPLTDSEHCGDSCSNCITLHGENATCQNGACSIPRCNIGEHPVYVGNVIDRCEPNTVVACAPTVTRSNDSIRNCELTAGDNVIKSICSSEGKCLVLSCADGFRRNPTNTGCESITCQANEFLKGNTCYRYVDTCEEGFHISEDRKECVPNTNTACAPTTGWPGDGTRYLTYADYAVTCPSTLPVCQRNGKCGCQDGQVLNREGNACVPGVCLNYPGVSRATVQNGICKPLDCTSDYKLVNRGGYPLCSPICTCGCKCGSLMDGYMSGECSEQTTYSAQGACIAVECAKGYKDWHGICLPVNNCCGSACKNCQTEGKNCSSTGTSGVCQ